MTATATVPLSFAHLAQLDTGPPALFDLMAAAGFSSTSLRMVSPVPGGPTYPLSRRAELAEAKAAIARTGVTVLYIEVLPLSATVQPKSLLPVLEAGAGIGASRIVAMGDDPDFALVAARLAELCELGRPLGLSVDLEFLPYKPVATLGHAVDVVQRCGQPNAHVLLDALHFYRSRSNLDQLRVLDPALIGTFQICDAPATAPETVEGLVFEARNRRLLPGDGELDLDALMDAMPAGLPIGVEVPLALDRPELSPLERARLSVGATRKYLARRAERNITRR